MKSNQQQLRVAVRTLPILLAAFIACASIFTLFASATNVEAQSVTPTATPVSITPDLALSVAVTQTTSANPGDIITLSVRPQNLTPNTVMHRVGLTHTIPANAFVPPDPATGGFEPWYCPDAGAPGTLCVIDLGDIPYSASPLPAIDLPLQILPQAPAGPITGSAVIGSLTEAENDLGNNSVTLPIQIQFSGPTPTPRPTMTPLPTAPPGPTSLILRLDAEPASKQNFRISGPTGAFRLDDALPDDGDGVADTIQLSPPPGTHVFTTEVPYSWNLVNIQCSATNVLNADLRTGQFSVQLRANRPLSCTISMARSVHVLARVWEDKDANGAIASAEPYLAGWRVSLVAQAAPFPPTRVLQTGSTGQANFTNQPPTRYKVCEQLQAGWRNTRPTTLDSSGSPCFWLSMTPGQTATIWYGNQRTTVASANSQWAALSFDIAQRPDVPFDDAGYDGHIYDDSGSVTDQLVYLPMLLD